jgi:tetratricopeptide (TPR) repeat protein
MPGVMILAGFGTWALAQDLLGGRIGRVVLSGIIVLAALGINASKTYPDDRLVRPQDYLIAIDAYRSRGERIEALDEANRARALFPRYPHFHRAAGMIYLDLGREPEALDALMSTLAIDPSDEEARRHVERLSGPRPVP